MALCKVGENDNRIILYFDEEHTTYKFVNKFVSNFAVKLTCEVEAGCKSGYLCNVIYYTGEKLGLVRIPMYTIWASMAIWVISWTVVL